MHFRSRFDSYQRTAGISVQLIALIVPHDAEGGGQRVHIGRLTDAARRRQLPDHVPESRAGRQRNVPKNLHAIR